MKELDAFLKLTLAFLFACVISFNLFVNQAMATGEFSKTCDNIILGDSVLSADCVTRNGSVQPTSLNLDQEIGNLNGKLSWGDHLFSLTCRDVGLGQSLKTREYVLNAECEKVDGYTYVPTEINLDEHIANINGNLEFE